MSVAPPEECVVISTNIPIKLGGYASGGYTGSCHKCGKDMWEVDKRATQCLPCAIQLVEEERLSPNPLQEKYDMATEMLGIIADPLQYIQEHATLTSTTDIYALAENITYIRTLARIRLNILKAMPHGKR